MNGDYLDDFEKMRGDRIDCCLTNNYDEIYGRIYPRFTRADLVPLVARYPSSGYRAVKKRICHFFDLEDVALGSGSEDLIVRLGAMFRAHGRRISAAVPIFYRIIESCGEDVVLLSDQDLLRRDLRGTDVAWIQNPNLFTGETREAAELIDLVRRNPHVLFVVDEAGMLTISEWQKYSLMSYATGTNVLVLASFSKIYGLSGLRAGFATGNGRILRELEERGSTFPLSSLAQAYLLSVLDHEKTIVGIREGIVRHKRELSGMLAMDPDIHQKSSLTNCLFFRSKCGRNVWKDLLDCGLFCLDLDKEQGMTEEGFVRLTVHSSKVIHRKVVRALGKFLKATTPFVA